MSITFRGSVFYNCKDQRSLLTLVVLFQLDVSLSFHLLVYFISHTNAVVRYLILYTHKLSYSISYFKRTRSIYSQIVFNLLHTRASGSSDFGCADLFSDDLYKKDHFWEYLFLKLYFLCHKLALFLLLRIIKILQLRLAKPVTHQTHTKLSPIPVPVILVSSKPVSYKQLIQPVKQSQPDIISKPIVQVPQRPPTSPTATPSSFKSLESLALLHTPLQAHHVQQIQSPIYHYNKQLQTAV